VAGKPEKQIKKEQDNKPEKQSDSLERTSNSPRVLASNEHAEPAAKEDESKKPKDPKMSDTKSGTGPLDSVASLPSVASEERRMLSAGGSDIKNFQSRILAAIREAIYFPKEALDRQKHGETVVQFSVNRDGSVANLSVSQPSGSTVLDDAALAIIRKASKNFPSIPDALAGESVHYVVPIHFKEKRTKSVQNQESGG